MATNMFQEMHDRYHDKQYQILGPSVLNFPNEVDASRQQMFTSHIKQFLTLANPDFPRVSTGFENVIGKLNTSAYKYLEGRWLVHDRINKYGDNSSVYILVLYNPDKDIYDMIERIDCENPSEIFGYLYNNEKMDSLEIGDMLQDEVLYATTSYDKNMNYCYGKEALVMSATDTSTLEDAIQIRRGWAEACNIVQTDRVLVPLNSNDILLNIFGDDDTYKVMPDVGEKCTREMKCAVRRINSQNALYDFQTQNMKNPSTGDIPYYSFKNSQITDIEVRYNGGRDVNNRRKGNNFKPFPESIFFQQLKYYYDACVTYADEITRVATEIQESGSKYTTNIGHYKSLYQNWNNTEYLWKNNDKAFSNIVITMKVKSLETLQEGYKITGRCGDKGVISVIGDDPRIFLGDGDFDDIGENPKEIDSDFNITFMDDCEMPYDEMGRPIDVVINSMAAIRRLIPGALVELELNHQSERIRQMLCKLPTYEDKARLVFQYLALLQQDQLDFCWDEYTINDVRLNTKTPISGKDVYLMDEDARNSFIDSICEKGFYIIKPPMGNVGYETIKNVYKKFPFTKKFYQVYINRWGMRKPYMKDMLVAYKHILILKQTSNKNISARSTGRTNKAGLPTKSDDKKTNLVSTSNTPIRISEIYALLVKIDPATLAKFTIFGRGSVIARKELSKLVTTDGNPAAVNIPLTDAMTNRNVEIVSAILKCMGIALDQIRDPLSLKENQAKLVNFYMEGYQILDYPFMKEYYSEFFGYYKDFIENYHIVSQDPQLKIGLSFKHAREQYKGKELSDTFFETVDMLILGVKLGYDKVFGEGKFDDFYKLIVSAN